MVDASGLVVPRALVDALVAHAHADLPNECCGMISGLDGRATRIHRAGNSESSPFMYVMDAAQQLRIMEAIDERGEDLLAIYHSHTRSAAYPSRTDVELAFYPGVIYVIISLADRDAPDVRGFLIARDAAPGEQIRQAQITIE